MKKLKDNWLVFNDKLQLVRVLAKDILNIAKESILNKGSFSIVLTGGQSVIALYEVLSQSESNWNKWHIYIGDERFLPKGDKDRNDLIISKIWLNGSLIPKKNIHFIKAEMGLIRAKKEYESTLKLIDKFDIVLLSVGEDGHVASLFPGHSYPEDQMVVIESNSPKLPKQRLSMSYKRLNKSNHVFKLLIGKSKQRPAYLLQNDVEIPAKKISGDCNRVYLTII